jgi:large subunit ribosomal protein L23
MTATIQPRLYNVLHSPVRTEKAFIKHEESKFTFYIRNETTKSEVKTAIEKIFGKQVKSVNIVASRTKTKGARKGRIGKKITMKKAIVTLEKGAKLDEIFGS